MDGTVVKEGLTIGGVRDSRGSGVIIPLVACGLGSGGVRKLTSEATSRFDHQQEFIIGQ